MNYLLFTLSFIIGILPIYIIGYYFYNKDTIKEPNRLLRNLFISGIISGIIVIIISAFGLIFFPKLSNVETINNIFILLFYCYIFVAFIEELSKFTMIYYLSYNSNEFDQAYDIVLYSVFVGLGFACFENIIYILGSDITISNIFLRGITAIPAHACFQTIMGYFLYLSKEKDKTKNISFSILIPVFLHGTYDFFIFSQNIMLLFGFILLLIFIIFYAHSKIKKVLQIDNSKLKSYCPNCGTKINYQYCSNCGYKKQ